MNKFKTPVIFKSPVTFVGLETKDKSFEFLFRRNIPEGILYAKTIEKELETYRKKLEDPLDFLKILMSNLLQKNPKRKWTAGKFAVVYKPTDMVVDKTTMKLLAKLHKEIEKGTNPSISFEIMISKIEHNGRKYNDHKETLVWEEFHYDQTFDSKSEQGSHYCNICHKPIEL
jgi:hypothetical protein